MSEEEEEDQSDKNEVLSNEQEQMGEALLGGSIQYSQIHMEEVHHRIQDIGEGPEVTSEDG